MLYTFVQYGPGRGDRFMAGGLDEQQLRNQLASMGLIPPDCDAPLDAVIADLGLDAEVRLTLYC